MISSPMWGWERDLSPARHGVLAQRAMTSHMSSPEGRQLDKWCWDVFKHCAPHGQARCGGALAKGTEASTEVMAIMAHHGWSRWCLHHERKRKGERIMGACADSCFMQPFAAFAQAFPPCNAAFGQLPPPPPPFSSTSPPARGRQAAAQRESTSSASPSPSPPRRHHGGGR